MKDKNKKGEDKLFIKNKQGQGHVEMMLSFVIFVGFLLFILIIVLVISGFIFRFNLLKPLRIYVKDTPHYNRYFHVSLTLSFYLIFVFHLINVIASR